MISINDSQPEDSSPVVPHERQVVDCVIEIWKEDPSTESLGMSKLHALVKQNILIGLFLKNGLEVC